ncbi:MAG: F0F1 ATP synthase subunit B [Oscillospiraceae bacterium]|nr:F0F1 ATP synthase subunit B [Oscillospiraceae bacterium]
MPHKIFSVMTVTVATFLLLTIIVVVFASVTDDTIVELGTILHFDAALLAKLAIQWFNILLLTFVLIRILYNPVRQFMINRAERIQGDIESAKKNNQEAQELKAKYENILANVDKETEEYKARRHREAVEEHDRIIFEAQEQAQHLKLKAEEEIKIQRENAADDIRKQIIEISTLMAARFVEQSMDRKTHDKFIDDALKDWSGQI